MEADELQPRQVQGFGDMCRSLGPGGGLAVTEIFGMTTCMAMMARAAKTWPSRVRACACALAPGLRGLSD